MSYLFDVLETLCGVVFLAVIKQAGFLKLSAKPQQMSSSVALDGPTPSDSFYVKKPLSFSILMTYLRRYIASVRAEILGDSYFSFCSSSNSWRSRVRVQTISELIR